MNKKHFVGSGVSFLSIFLACLLNFLIMGLVLVIVELFVETDFFAQVIIRLIVSIVSVAGISGVVTYFTAYKRAAYDVRMSSGNFWLATVLQLAISLLLKFTPIIAGGTVYLAGIFELGIEFNSAEDIEYIGLLDYLPAFLILSLIYYATIVICGFIGKNKRIKDRVILTGK